MTAHPAREAARFGQVRTRSPLGQTLNDLARTPAAWIGGGLVGLLLVASLLATWIAPSPPAQIDLRAQLQAPTAQHPLGTDFYGRDLLSRLVHGGRATLGAAFGAVALAMWLGTVLGLLAGSTIGWFGVAWVGVLDLMLAFPATLLALLVVAVLGPGLRSAALAIAIASTPSYARIVRSILLATRTAPYVEAAEVMGASKLHIVLRHLLPSTAGPVIALATVDFGWAIMHVAGLGFLGLGASPPQPEWGLMLFEGRQYLRTAVWTTLAPGAAISAAVVGLTLLGDALNDAIAPGRSS
jgi:peptide/nickel transport system permease protein